MHSELYLEANSHRKNIQKILYSFKKMTFIKIKIPAVGPFRYAGT